ncbi:hypothetical protein AD28_3582 [Escherichia coli 2-210-07_S4_C3]|nr:hypothetical protein AD28_3582 [Escherichia coli 2-210-07_S4_C3]KEM89296.1 hypothetical protein AC71_2778 [Escherichia coli 2-222-05_S4_C1]
MARKTKPLTDTEIKAAKPKDADCRFNLSMQHPFQLSLSVF